jgi:aminoglycoside phosphotransferase (APT) family kinase protein
VIGTPFFIMSYVKGRIEPMAHLPTIPAGDRRSIYLAMASTLARLHEVDWRKVGLAEFQRPRSFVLRQTGTWYHQFKASKTSEIPAMDRLNGWLTENAPLEEETSIVHGDFRPGNVVIDPEAPVVAAVLDWELAAIGHPLADLGYLLTPWYLPSGIVGVRGLMGMDLKLMGLPAPEDLVAAYAQERGLPDVRGLRFFVIFSLFRLASILQGVYARAAKGNSSNPDAAVYGRNASLLAEQAWSLARDS